MAVDLGVFQRQKTLLDQNQLQAAFELKKQLAAAQIMGVQAQIAKAGEVDATKLGENAFLKAAQGLPLTPQETAAARLLDAKSGGIQFDPVNGGLVQKPRISDKIGLDGLTPQGAGMIPQGTGPTAAMGMPPQLDPSQLANPFSGGMPSVSAPAMPAAGTVPAVSAQTSPMTDLDRSFQEQLTAAAGNPKLIQSLKTEYAKNKIAFNADESKNAGYADRLSAINPTIAQNQEAGMSQTQRALAAVPIFGNKLVSPDYQQFDQAQRDFINAQLRRESGAVIAPSEFENAQKQYLPQPGDSPAVLYQKERNRQTAVQSMQRSAGPAYGAGQQQSNPSVAIVKPTKAPDGHMYISDPNRPGKYLRVD